MSETEELHVLPEHWAWSAMSKVCDKIQDGTHFSPEQDRQLPEGDFPYVTAKNVRRWGLDLSDISYLSEKDHQQIYQRCNPATGDVLLVKDGVNAGDAAINTFEGEISLLSSVCMLRTKSEVLLEGFLRYFLLSPQGYRLLTGQMTGTAIKRIILRKVRETPVPVAPLNEQRRIIGKVEELLSDLDAGVAALERAKTNLKRYRAAVLKAAVDGSLTAEWRAKHPKVEPASKLLERILVERRRKWESDQLAKFKSAGKEPPKNWKTKYVEPLSPETTVLSELPEGWCWSGIEQVTALVTKGSSPGWQGFEYVEDGISFVRSQNIRFGKLDIGDLVHLPPEFNATHQNSIIRTDDVLLNLVGASIGRSAVATEAINGANTNQAVGIIRLIEGSISNSLLVYFLLSPQLQSYIAKTKADVARANFNLDDIRPMPIPFPPSSEQDQIVTELTDVLSQIEVADIAINHSLIRAARLRQSVLKEAFEGKLVPQDPSDEPASVLLDRINSESQPSKGKGRDANEKPRRKSKRKAT